MRSSAAVLLIGSFLFPSSVPAAHRFETFDVASVSLKETLPVNVFVPATAVSGESLPVVYAVLGQVFWNEQAGLLARLSGNDPDWQRATVVAVPLPDTSTDVGTSVFQVEGDRWHAFAQFVAEELPLAIETRYASGARQLLGFSVGAVMALDVAMNRPDRFERVAAISPGWMNWDNTSGTIGENYTARAINQLVEGCAERSLPKIWMNWGDGNLDWERLSRENGARVSDALRNCGATVEIGATVPGDHGLPLIAPSLDPAFRFLLDSE